MLKIKINNSQTENKKIILNNFKHMTGKHCETTSLRKVLSFYGFELKEEVLLGMAGGIGFQYVFNSNMPAPFIGTRNGDCPAFLNSACSRLGVGHYMKQTDDPVEGHNMLMELLQKGKPVIAYGDTYYLSYFGDAGHFGGHAFVIYGIDERKNEAYISDRGGECQVISLDELIGARSSIFMPFPPRHSLLEIEIKDSNANYEAEALKAMKCCYEHMTNQNVKKGGLMGIKAWGDTIEEWTDEFSSRDLYECLKAAFINIETGGTGGGAFRYMYSEFIREMAGILKDRAMGELADLFYKSGHCWNEISRSLLTDMSSDLRRTRQLLLEKERLFMEFGTSANEQGNAVLKELKELSISAANHLKKPEFFLSEAKQNIHKCYEIESQAFDLMNKILKRYDCL